MPLIKISDSITPDLRQRVRATADRRPLLEAMGQAVKALGIQAFTSPEKRAQAWAPRKDDEPHALLQKSTMLRKSIRVIDATNDQVTIGSDRPYAAVHQLGSEKQGIPSRPYLPFYQTGQMTALGRQRVERALVAALRVRGF